MAILSFSVSKCVIKCIQNKYSVKKIVIMLKTVEIRAIMMIYAKRMYIRKFSWRQFYLQDVYTWCINVPIILYKVYSNLNINVSVASLLAGKIAALIFFFFCLRAQWFYHLTCFFLLFSHHFLLPLPITMDISFPYFWFIYSISFSRTNAKSTKFLNPWYLSWKICLIHMSYL